MTTKETLETAAEKYEDHALISCDVAFYDAFIAGALWERERAKVLVEALENLSDHMPVVSVEYLMGYTDDVKHPAKEALAKYRESLDV